VSLLASVRVCLAMHGTERLTWRNRRPRDTVVLRSAPQQLASAGAGERKTDMALDDPAGSVSDVLDARQALAAAVKAPRWMQPLAVVGGAAAMAALTGGGLTGSGFAIAVVIILATIYVPIFVLVRQRRALGVRLRRRRRTKRRWLFTWLVLQTSLDWLRRNVFGVSPTQAAYGPR
jgi:hypothetical protein